VSHVDLHTVTFALQEAAQESDTLNATEFDVDGPGGKRRPDLAQTTRRLLALSDKLDLAAALVRQEYWAMKGNERITF
jgi:hypothetical protein